MALYGAIAAVRAQLAGAARFAPAFDYVLASGRAGTAEARLLAGLVEGQSERVPLGDGAFALVQAYLTKPRNDARWETHRAYIDVQAVISGVELMEVADRALLSMAEDLTPETDNIFYEPFEGGSVLRFSPGISGVYFPEDAHRGLIALGKPALVRKVVIKVPIGV